VRNNIQAQDIMVMGLVKRNRLRGSEKKSIGMTGMIIIGIIKPQMVIGKVKVLKETIKKFKLYLLLHHLETYHFKKIGKSL